MKTSSLVLTWLALSAGCVLGGANEDPSQPISAVRGDASLDAVTLDAATPGAAPEGPLDAAPATIRDAAKAVDASTRDTGVGGDAGAQSCMPRVPATTCDPVTNTGCPPLTQCDLVPEAASPTGRCVFRRLSLGAACGADGLTETCAPPNACLKGACHAPCYCNRDCGAGQCCRDDVSLVPGGAFKVCGPC